MKIEKFQEILIDIILNSTGKDLKTNETIAENIGIEDMEWDGENIIFVLMNDDSEFELKIKKL